VRGIRLGTRGSKLALWQAEHVAGQLRAAHPGLAIELLPIRTTGDKRMDVPLQAIGDKSLFIREIEAALADRTIDLAVHSLKDVPSRLAPRFAIAAVLEREDARDVLLTRSGVALSQLQPGARVGTGSLRREAQLRAVRPDLELVPIRGNVDTRVRKLYSGEFEAIVLAAAGLKRLGIDLPDLAYLEPEVCLPSPGQAALCVEALAGRRDMAELAAAIDHTPTRQAVEAERAFAAELDAGCRVPVAAYAIARAGALELRVLVASADGRHLIRAQGAGQDPLELGQRLAREALDRGAGALLAALP
jgi:hydroxymethylbilane synthase